MNYSDFSKETVSKISAEKENFGKLEKRDEKVILEHTSANPNGPFHIGHVITSYSIHYTKLYDNVHDFPSILNR